MIKTRVFVIKLFYLSGYGFSAISPGMNAFTERHLKLTDRVASFYTFIGAAISLIMPLLLGQLFHAHPMVLFLIAFAFEGVAISCFVLLRLWISVSGVQKPSEVPAYLKS